MLEGAFRCPVPLTNHPKTRGKIDIKIYLPYPQVILKFRSLKE